MSRQRIVFNYPSSEDSLSPPEKKLKKEMWDKRLKKLESGRNSDCTINVGKEEKTNDGKTSFLIEKTIPAHKVYLCDFKYFTDKFENDPNFKGEECNQINIPDYEYGIVYEMVKYIYTLKANISTENVEDLLRIADQYRVKLLFERAQNFMVKHIEHGNVIDCLILTEHIIKATLLKSASIDYILDHYFEVKATESWKKLSLELLSEIFHHEMLNKRITDINDETVDELLDLAEKHHVKKLAEEVKKFKNRV